MSSDRQVLKDLQDENQLLKNENQANLELLGEILFDKMRIANDEKRTAQFQQIFHNKSPTTQSQNDGGGQKTNQENNCQCSNLHSHGDLPFPIQVEDPTASKYTSQRNSSHASVATTIHCNYQLLLLYLSETLLPSDARSLKEWSRNFAIKSARDSEDILSQLDKKEVISDSNLSKLRDFFISIGRNDLKNAIDVFLRGDYSLLRQIRTG